MIERTISGDESFNDVLAQHLEQQRWTPEEKAKMFEYIGHHFVSAEAALGVIDLQQEVHDRIDNDLAGQGEALFSD